MPIYEYSCPKCGTFEHVQKYTDPVLQVCPECGEPVKKLISRSFGVIYKAGGYYVSDHRSGDYKQKSKEDTGSGSSPAPSTDSKPATDSKPRAAAE